jgi:hypothetical protein
VKALASGELANAGADVVLIGSIDAVNVAAERANVSLTFEVVPAPPGGPLDSGVIPVLDSRALAASDL